MMKKKRSQPYNEIDQDVYVPKYWSITKLIFLSVTLLLLGFLLNFSIDSKLKKFLESTLAKNEACPIKFERIETSYFIPKISIIKPVIQGICFGQPQNQLQLKNFEISVNGPSFYPLGVRFHINLKGPTGKSYVNIYPTLSIFSLGIKIEKTIIDSEILSIMTENNFSPINGLFGIEGFFEFSSGVMENGQLTIVSNNLTVPAQRMNGFDIGHLELKKLSLKAQMNDPGIMIIEELKIGDRTAPLQISTKGQIKLNTKNIMDSSLELNGDLNLSEIVLVNYAFLKLFLPENKSGGNYKLKVQGPLRAPGMPKFY